MQIKDIIGGSKKRSWRGPRKKRILGKALHNLKEGGAQAGVGVIHHSEIEPTLRKLEKELGMPLRNNTLGSVGKKEFSGDIDIAIKIDSPEELAKFADRLAAAPSIKDVKKSSVFMTTVDIVGYDNSKQADGRARTGKVQVDFMPGNPEWMKTYYHAPHEKGMSKDGKHSKYKGTHRNIMIASIAGALNVKNSEQRTDDGRPLEQQRWMWSPTDGLIRVKRTPVPNKAGTGYTKKNSNTILKGPYKDPDEIAKQLGLNSGDDLYSFETLLAALKKNHKPDVVNQAISAFKDNPAIQQLGMPTELGESSALNEKQKGREINHIEDLLLFHGSAGGERAIETLATLKNNSSNTTIKWDGSPAIVFGRNEAGEFVLTDKSGFSAKGYNGRVTEPQALEKMFLGRKMKDPTPEKVQDRKDFAARMRGIWNTIESATPEDFRGYLLGDLMYYSTPGVEKGRFVFTPNTTTYSVDTNSDIGKKIAASSVGVVVHVHIDESGAKTAPDIQGFKTGSLLIMPPVNPQIPNAVGQYQKELQTIQAKLKRAGNIDQFINPPAELKMSDFQDLLYAHVNSTVKTGDTPGKNFGAWLQSARISDVKKQRVAEYIKSNQQVFNNMWHIFNQISAVKDKIIAHMDEQPADIEAYTDGKRGGEGYVVGKDMKLVKRSGFTAANMAKER